jgi:selenocysteine lyase/cysteine desulfurase
VNDVAAAAEAAHAAGALVYVDAVHYAPHGPIDVAEAGVDFLACSAYKFFGPHVGILYGRAELLDSLPAYKVRPADDRWETGTQNHEGIAGMLAAVEYLAGLGDRFGEPAPGPGRRGRVLAGMRAIEAYERDLAATALEAFARVAGLRVHGLTDPARAGERTPTFAVTLDGWTPRALAVALAAEGIFAWDGDFYATTLVEDLGLAPTGGVVRLGFAHYTTRAEVDRLVTTLASLAARRAGT